MMEISSLWFGLSATEMGKVKIDFFLTDSASLNSVFDFSALVVDGACVFSGKFGKEGDVDSYGGKHEAYVVILFKGWYIISEVGHQVVVTDIYELLNLIYVFGISLEFGLYCV